MPATAARALRGIPFITFIVLAALAADMAPVIGQGSPPSSEIGTPISQVGTPIAAGSRVRLTAPSLGLSEAVGTVQETSDEALVVEFEFPVRVGTVPRSEIVAMDVATPGGRNLLKGFGVGFLIGAGTGAMIGLASGDDEGTFLAFSAEEKAAMGAGALGLIGGVVGLGIAALNPNETWSSALPENVAVNVLPLVGESGPGVHVGLSLRLQ